MRAFLCGSDSLTGRSYGYRTDAQLKAELKQQGKPLPRYVEQEFEAYLQCGCAEHGFFRVRCESCRREHLLLFSCKRRGFCPSCGARRKTNRGQNRGQDLR